MLQKAQEGSLGYLEQGKYCHKIVVDKKDESERGEIEVQQQVQIFIINQALKQSVVNQEEIKNREPGKPPVF